MLLGEFNELFQGDLAITISIHSLEGCIELLIGWSWIVVLIANVVNDVLELSLAHLLVTSGVDVLESRYHVLFWSLDSDLEKGSLSWARELEIVILLVFSDGGIHFSAGNFFVVVSINFIEDLFEDLLPSLEWFDLVLFGPFFDSPHQLFERQGLSIVSVSVDGFAKLHPLFFGDILDFLGR
jgi:hypothetical protein